MILDTFRTSLSDRYTIDRELGQGGMATVYLAHDLKHDREVAIKVLHADLGAALGADRFLSEIRTTARLQHPHILPLLDSGDAGGLLYYVMPLVTGETLRSRLERERQLPIDDAVLIAREVADALGYAHGHGVIHRDIKPENILLQGGHALVADFGIALAVQQAGGQRMTQTGLSLGTPQYMSPEQAMGERTIDARSDIYALGAVTYEMLVGEAPFTGPTVQAIVARVMTEEPRGLVIQRKAIPDELESVVLRSLEKLPADRWATAAEFIAALDGGPSSSFRAGRTTRARVRSPSNRWTARLRDPVVITCLVIALAGVLFALSRWRGQPQLAGAPIVRFGIPVMRGGGALDLGYNSLAISPDGKTMVYVGRTPGKRQQLMVRPIDETAAHPLPGTEDAASPIFSPDSRSIAYVKGNQLYRVPAEGGQPQLLATAPGTFNGASWSSTGVIVTSGNSGLFVIPENGGPPRALSRFDESRGELYQDGPLVLDDAKVVLYSSWHSTSVTGAKLAIASLVTGKTTMLDLLCVAPLGIIDGVLVYVATSGAVMGVPIDVAHRQVTGTPVQLTSNVAVNLTTGLARASLSRDGTLFYQSGSQRSQVVLRGPGGVTRPMLDDTAVYAFPRLSPDAARLALTVAAGDRRDVWLYEIGSGTPTRVTTEGTVNERPEWSPDGKQILYRSDQGARSEIWERPVDLSSPAVPLVAGSHLDVFEAVISPDGKYIAYQVDTLGADLFYRATSGDNTPRPIATNPKAIETMQRISPDGHWIAFATDESGTSEVVVQPFPGPGGRVQVSSGGGTEPVWSHDGRHLFYRGGGNFMSANILATPTFSVASRDTLFGDDYVVSTSPHANYDVMPDGTHFVLLQPAADDEMIVVVNWKKVMHAAMAPKATP